MAVEEDLSLEAKAREWLDMAQTKWRLQTMQHRSRYNPKTGEYKQLPTRVRRFLNGTPVSMKARVLSILKESAPYSCPVFDLETGDAKYVPTNTFIRKDGPELTSGGADATYTIVQDLKLLDEAGDIFGMRDESSCAQVGEAVWHWDEPDVMDCPDGSQGVSYQIANVSRDRETDLFSYVVRKVQALTVHVPPVTAACTERSRVTVESWDNVYGEPGAFRWDPVRGGSAALDVPEACDRSAGTLVKVSVTRNADCTYRVEVERTEAVPGLGMYFVQHDRYRTEEGERTLNAFAPLPRQGVEYDHGLVTRYQSERNEDGTWTNDVNSSLERPVESSTVETRVTPRGTVSMRTDTNMPAPASGISSDFGSWKTVKTPGGLYTNEYVEYARKVADNLGLVCTDTAFLKTHETQGSAASVPSSGHVPPAAGGLVTTWTYDTDSEGLVTKRERTQQEHTVDYAVRRVSRGWLGTTSGFTHRSVTPDTALELLSQGGAGTIVEARMTDGGMFDVDVREFEAAPGGTLGAECSKTVYEHVHETAVSAASVGTCVADAGGGVTRKVLYSVDADTGAVTERETVTTELEVPESRRTVRVTPRGTTVRTVRSNSPDRPADASEPGQTTEFEVTPGGRYNVTLEETTPREGSLETGCQKDAFEEADSASQTSRTKGPDHVLGGSGGVYREAVSRLGDDGLWENRTVDHTETRNVDNGVDVVVTARGKRRTVKTRNVQDPGSDIDSNLAGQSLRTSRTRGGLYDVERTTVSARSGKNGTDCQEDAFVHSHADTAMGEMPPSGHVSGGSGGVYSERTSRLGDDGLWETRKVTHTEKQAVDDGVEVVVTARGKRRTVKTRSVSPQRTPAEPSAAGQSLRTSRTRGGLYDVEETSFTPNASDMEKSCREDRYLKSEGKSYTRNSSIDGHVSSSGSGGKYAERVQRLGDDGLWEVNETEHTEREVEGGLDVSVTARGVRRTVVTRQTGRTGVVPGANDVGSSLKRSVTRGGRYDLEETTFTPRAGASMVGRSVDLFEITSSTGETKKDQPDVNGVNGGSGGRYREKVARLGDDGLWGVDDVEHEERKVEGHRVEIRSTRMGKVTRRTDTHMPVNLGVAALNGVTGIGQECLVEMTRGGLCNITSTTVQPSAGAIQKGCSKDAFLHTHSTTTAMKAGEAASGDHVAAAGGGKYVEETLVLNDLGVWEKRTVENTEIPETVTSSVYMDAFGERRLNLDVHGSRDRSLDASYSEGAQIKSVEQELTKGKSYTSRTLIEKPVAVSSGMLHFDKTTSKGLAIYYDFVVFRNQKLNVVRKYISDIQKKKYSDGGEGSFANHPSINISPNRFGLWDGTVSLTTTYTPKAWASGGTLKSDNFTQEYTLKDVSVSPLETGTSPSQVTLLEAITTENHVMGAGVGKDKLQDVLQGTLVRGSSFSYHPSGQSFQYDLITKRTVKYKIIKASTGISTDDI